MKILLLSEDDSVFEDHGPSRTKILDYASLVDTLFFVAVTSFEKNIKPIKQVGQNAWIYKTNSLYKFLRIWDVLQLVSFEVRAQGVLQADLIICEDFFISVLAGYILAKKFKKPLYIFLSETNEKKVFIPKKFKELKNILFFLISWFILSRANCIKVDNFEAEEKLKKFLRKSSHPSVEIIRPFVNDDKLSLKGAKEAMNEKRIEGNFIEKKFPQFRFTAVTFVDTVEQVELSLDILKKLNTHFPPTSLILIPSNNLEASNIDRLVRGSLKPFVYVEPWNDALPEYLASSNVFWGISEGEMYEEILNQACIVGSTIIALSSSISKRLIEDNITGFLCPNSFKRKIVEYFAEKNIFFMDHPSVALGFKMNISISFKQQFTNTKNEYMKKLKLSWEKCVENYKKDQQKYYNL